MTHDYDTKNPESLTLSWDVNTKIEGTFTILKKFENSNNSISYSEYGQFIEIGSIKHNGSSEQFTWVDNFATSEALFESKGYGGYGYGYGYTYSYVKISDMPLYTIK